MPRNPRHEKLLADEDVSRWYRNLARGNETTAKDWLRKLGLFCERTKTTPATLMRMDQETVGDLLEDYVEEYPRTSTAKVLTVVRSLFARKGIKIVREITMPDVEHRDQHVPSRDQLRKAVSGANRRAKAAIGIVAFVGQVRARGLQVVSARFPPPFRPVDVRSYGLADGEVRQASASRIVRQTGVGPPREYGCQARAFWQAGEAKTGPRAKQSNGFRLLPWG